MLLSSYFLTRSLVLNLARTHKVGTLREMLQNATVLSGDKSVVPLGFLVSYRENESKQSLDISFIYARNREDCTDGTTPPSTTLAFLLTANSFNDDDDEKNCQ